MTATEPRTLADLLAAQIVRRGDALAIRFKQYGIWHRVSWRRYGEEVDAVAKALLGFGLRPQENVAVLAENRPEWLQQARTLPMAQVGADILRGLVPQSVAAQGQNAADAAKAQAEKAAEVGQAIQVITNVGQGAAGDSGTESAGSPEDSGYNDADRKAMERALQGVQ